MSAGLDHVPSYSMWTPRKPSAVLPACSWKVTARFDVLLTTGKRVECVRIHGFYGLGIVLHYELSVFLRTFKRASKDKAAGIRYRGGVRQVEGRRGYGRGEVVERTLLRNRVAR